ncbi:MAG: AGE family epimerase/isomerase [Pseudomonadota bacterium]
MQEEQPGGAKDHPQTSLADPDHRAWLRSDAARQLDFFLPSLRGDGSFGVLDWDGAPLKRGPQELHTTTRLVHSYALGHAIGHRGADDIIDAGLTFLWKHHRDQKHGGYVWAVAEDGTPADGTKLAYGHVFVLLAASSAKAVGHPDADRLMADIIEVLEQHYWEEGAGRFCDEFNHDWTPFSSYRGMNANMHGVEALLAAFEATGDPIHLSRAGQILDFFIGHMAAENGWRIPEHYTSTWQIDPDYAGNPMFRPAGTTPGHALEFARLRLQHWDLAGRPESPALEEARALTQQALADAWGRAGGLAYTLDRKGTVAIPDRYWWPVTEGIGVLATLLKIDPSDEDEDWYHRLWDFAARHFVDAKRGGWFPEIDADGAPTARQFEGKPDIYHALQATLYPLAPGVARHLGALRQGAAGSPLDQAPEALFSESRL